MGVMEIEAPELSGLRVHPQHPGHFWEGTASRDGPERKPYQASPDPSLPFRLSTEAVGIEELVREEHIGVWRGIDQPVGRFANEAVL